jgi:hypothetical protein
MSGADGAQPKPADAERRATTRFSTGTRLARFARPTTWCNPAGCPKVLTGLGLDIIYNDYEMLVLPLSSEVVGMLTGASKVYIYICIYNYMCIYIYIDV